MNFKANESAQKLRGGYYTPPDVARFLARWVTARGPGRVLEPSCGDGVLLEATLSEFRSAAGNSGSVLGCEIQEQEAAVARARLLQSGAAPGSRVLACEFLEWSLAHPSERFDGAIGNPPFIRYQYLDAALQERAQRLYELHGLPFTKHTNAWGPFVIAALAHLRPGGRLAMVVPTELLHVLHAHAVRRFLLERCARVLIVDPGSIWFDRTLQGVVLLLAERAGSAERGSARGVAIVSAPDRSVLQQHPESLLERAAFVGAHELGAGEPGAKWMSALLAPAERELLATASTRPEVARFAEIARAEVGIVTGANGFFLVSDATVERYGLQRWARPMFGRSEHVRGLVHDSSDQESNRRRGLPAHFLHFDSSQSEELPEGLRDYLRLGEEQGLQRRYKCRIREPWYVVPSVWRAPVAMLKRSHHFPRLVLNRAGALTTDTAYRITPLLADADDLVASFLNPLTALCAELEGRHYGGGVLELVPSEIAKLPIPLLGDAPRALGELDGLLRAERSPYEILLHRSEEFRSRLRLPVEAPLQLFEAWDRLRRRRQHKADGVGAARSPTPLPPPGAAPSAPS
jgi:adenine-specific DNA methylase